MSGLLVLYSGAGRRTEKPWTRLGRRFLQVTCWCDVVMLLYFCKLTAGVTVQSCCNKD